MLEELAARFIKPIAHGKVLRLVGWSIFALILLKQAIRRIVWSVGQERRVIDEKRSLLLASRWPPPHPILRRGPNM